MKLTVKQKQLDANPALWLRRAGYAYIEDRESGHESFVRRLTRDFYPRFHVYYTLEKGEGGEELVAFDLHLDQKRPGYQGFHRHNAEYDGEAVEGEIERLKTFLTGDLPGFFN